MKRMNEVFELPVSTDFDFEHDWSAEDEGDDICLSGFDPIASGNKVVLLAVASSKAYSGIDSKIADIAQHAAHAINNVEALADALEKAISLLSRPASTRLIHEQELLNTLNAYRGAK